MDASQHSITHFASNSAGETEEIAARLAESLAAGGGVVALTGELGAGKTQFVRGLVRGLGGDPRQVHSPTFVLMHEYACPDRRVFHLDAYRVAREDLEAIGVEELLAAAREGDVVAIEWAEKVRGLLPTDAIWISIETNAPTRRRIIIARGDQVPGCAT